LLVRYDSTLAVPVWATGFGGRHSDSGYAVATDSGGDVYLSGLFGDTAVVGADTLHGTALHLLVARFDARGGGRWAVAPAATTGNATSSATAVCLVGSDVVVAGDFGGGYTFGATSFASNGLRDAFFARLDANQVFALPLGLVREANRPAVWPNPVAAGQPLRVTLAGAHHLTLRDLCGRAVRSWRTPTTLGGDLPVGLSTTGLLPGVYMLTMVTRAATWCQRLVVE
jgi:hypothetical protein